MKYRVVSDEACLVAVGSQEISGEGGTTLNLTEYKTPILFV